MYDVDVKDRSWTAQRVVADLRAYSSASDAIRCATHVWIAVAQFEASIEHGGARLELAHVLVARP